MARAGKDVAYLNGRLAGSQAKYEAAQAEIQKLIETQANHDAQVNELLLTSEKARKDNLQLEEALARAGERNQQLEDANARLMVEMTELRGLAEAWRGKPVAKRVSPVKTAPAAAEGLRCLFVEKGSAPPSMRDILRELRQLFMDCDVDHSGLLDRTESIILVTRFYLAAGY